MLAIAGQGYNYVCSYRNKQLGYISEDNKVQLASLFNKLPKKENRKVTNKLSEIAILSSFIIYFSKYSTTWIHSTDE